MVIPSEFLQASFVFVISDENRTNFDSGFTRTERIVVAFFVHIYSSILDVGFVRFLFFRHYYYFHFLYSVGSF